MCFLVPPSYASANNRKKKPDFDVCLLIKSILCENHHVIQIVSRSPDNGCAVDMSLWHDGDDGEQESPSRKYQVFSFLFICLGCFYLFFFEGYFVSVSREQFLVCNFHFPSSSNDFSNGLWSFSPHERTVNRDARRNKGINCTAESTSDRVNLFTASLAFAVILKWAVTPSSLALLIVAFYSHKADSDASFFL